LFNLIPHYSAKILQLPHKSRPGRFQTVYCLFHGSNGLHLLKLISISLEWTHSGHVMCSWSELDPHLTLSPNIQEPGSGCGYEEPVWRHFQTGLGLFHGSNGLYLLKLISISLEWTHSGHVMCSWSELDPHCLTSSPIIQLRSCCCHRIANPAIFRQFLASSMDPMDCIC
jgi:hypothetical protein